MRVAKIIIGDINRLTGGYLYEKKLVEYLRGKGIQADVVSIPNIPYMLQFFSNLWLPFYFLGKRYDVIIEDEMTHPAVWLFNFWAKYVKKAKVVAIVHMFRSVAVSDSWQMPFVKFMEKSMLMSTDLVIANSRHTKEQTEKMGLPDEAIEVVYPGFDTHLVRDKQSRPTDEVKLLFVGNWDPRKGLETLVEAMYRLNNPKIVLDIVGDDSPYPMYTRRIKRKVTHWGLEGRVRYHGRIDRESIGRFYSDADIFVLPPSYEAFGIVFAEAMSFGLPIIATNAGGIPELVDHDENGLLVPPNDANALADAIDKLASSTELREEMGRKSYEKSKELNTWDDCFRIIYGHLKRLAADDT
jgi:glycosyltransferase involved in cell wall biosynthesis